MKSLSPPDTIEELNLAPSILLALHARYESVWDQHHLADLGYLAAPTNDESAFQFAKQQLEAEADSLRDAALRQTPASAEQAAIYAYYASSLADEVRGTIDSPLTEQLAFAVDTLLLHLFVAAGDHQPDARLYRTAVANIRRRAKRLFGLAEATA